jgi:hypothetical protein
MKRIVLLIAVLLLTAACTSTQPPESQLESPSDHSSDEVIVEAGEIQFDGEQCTYDGASELTPGIYEFVVKDLSDKGIDFALEIYLDGKTYQDYLEHIGDGETHLPEVDWIDVPATRGSAKINPDGGEVHTYILAKEGNYGLVSWTYHPWHIWPCGQLWVVDTLLE